MFSHDPKSELSVKRNPDTSGVLWFLLAASLVLAVTGSAKLLSAFGHAKLLNDADPLTGLPFRQLMLAAGAIELSVAGACLFSKSQSLSLLLIAGLATDLVLYRIGVRWMGWQKHCDCLGNLTDALHIPPHTADMAMKIILAYLLIGSYGFLIHQCWKNRKLKVGSSELGSQSSQSGAGN